MQFETRREKRHQNPAGIFTRIKKYKRPVCFNQTAKLNNAIEQICHFVSTENLKQIDLIFSHCHFSGQLNST